MSRWLQSLFANHVRTGTSAVQIVMVGVLAAKIASPATVEVLARRRPLLCRREQTAKSGSFVGPGTHSGC